MKFELRNGPWKTVFEGRFQSHEIEILTNPEQIFIVSIFEKTGEEIEGVVMQAFYVYSAVGESETFVESLKQEAITLSRHDGKRTVQFLAVGGNQSYAKAVEEDVLKLADQLIGEVKESTSKMEDVAKSFDLQLTRLEKCSSAVKQAFFSQPMIIPMLAREKRVIELEKEEAIIEEGIGGNAAILGMTKDGKHVKEPLQMFQRTLVADGTKEQRINFVRIIVESYLLANIPVIIIDDGLDFLGLGIPTKNVSELQSHGVDIEPIGFPIKEFEPGTNLNVNLNVLSAEGILELFGCNEKESEKILSKALEKKDINSIQELIERIEALDENSNLFLKKRVERIVKLADSLYPKMFAGKNNIDEIAKSWYKKIGRASIVKVNSLDPRALIFVLNSISNELVDFFGRQPETGKPRMLLAIPNIADAFALKKNSLQQDFVKALAEMKGHGIGFVAGSERRSDLDKELLQIMETKAGIVGENDIALDLPNSKNYRIIPRPSISRSKNEN